jgi:hypothetical protein
VTDLHKALADIGNIRLSLAAGTMFRGFGPTVIAATGTLAFVAAAAQSMWLDPNGEAFTFVAVWSGIAVISVILIGLEMLARTRRQQSGLADEMLLNTVEHFLPIGAAGLVISAILLRFAPDAAWLLPGLWQMLLAVGLFVAMRFLPRAVAIAAAWYFLAGAAVLIISSQERALLPWAMGIPFGVGQLLMAGILHVALGGEDAKD